MNQLTTTRNTSMSFLPLMPLDPAWLEQSVAFTHADSRMALAYTKILFAAWRGSPAGSLPSSHAHLAAVTGQTLAFVEENYEILTEGYLISATNLLHHVLLTKLCVKMTQQYGEEIEAFSISSVIAAQDPLNFRMSKISAKTKKKPLGLTEIPDNYSFETCSEDLRSWCDKNQYEGAFKQAWIMERFIAYAIGKGTKAKNWDATFRTFAGNGLSYGHYPPSDPNGVVREDLFSKPRTNAFSSLQNHGISKGDIAAAHNREVMSRAAGAQRINPRGAL